MLRLLTPRYAATLTSTLTIWNNNIDLESGKESMMLYAISVLFLTLSPVLASTKTRQQSASTLEG